MSLSAFVTAIYNFFINELLAGYRNLHFRRIPSRLRPLPAHITRRLIPGPTGSDPSHQLELLVCSPRNPDPKARSILFQHGCFGHASVWLEWMTYLHEHNYGGRTYALSLRGHGASWLPRSWFGMVWGTTHEDMCQDLLAGIDAVRAAEREEYRSTNTNPILIGHSAGGELIQSLLAHSRTTVPALGLIGSIPHFGADPAFDNWAKMDPLVNLRLVLHSLHPKSNISTPQLMRNAYFGLDTKVADVEEFGWWTPHYEAMRWPFVTLGKKGGDGVLRRLDLGAVVENIGEGVSNRSGRGGDMVLVLNGKADVLIQGTGERVVAEYMVASEKVGGRKGKGVAFVEIDRAGHHVQNDVQWEKGAEALLGWLQQV